MHAKKLVWHIFPATLLVTISSLVGILWFGSVALDRFYTNWSATALEDRAYLIEEQVAYFVVNGMTTKLNSFCRRVGRKSSTRITVIDPLGAVIADSDENPTVLANHGNRSEIKSAMAGEVGSQLRLSASLGVRMLYVAIPLVDGPRQVGGKFYVLRVSMPSSAIAQTLQRLRVKVAFSGLIIAAFAMLAAVAVAKKISKPLEEMTGTVEKYAAEDFSRAIAIPSDSSLEVEKLAAAMQGMALKLRGRIDTIVNQRNELQTILASMAEAIVVIDNKRRITTINYAAARLLDIAAKKAVGRNIQEMIRNIDIERLVDMTLSGARQVAEEFVLIKGERVLYLQFSGVRLQDGNGQPFGAVIVLNDVTHTRRLENIRREFVANVSHELMTPLTSIKGYTETILDNGLDDREQTENFLRIILKQSERQQAIVNDLLELSRIENEIESGEIKPLPTNLKGVLEDCIQVCGPRAAVKEMKIGLDCPPDLIIPMDAQLIEQAVENLLVNAIKYSNQAGEILVRGELRAGLKGEETVAISVKDHGVGIGKEHLPRLFERFYRSDKDRSRKLGGTGLGLAIVKHIVQAHNGTVQVESEIGRGSVFTILIPAS